MSTVAVKQRMNAEEFFAWCNRPENRDRHFELERGEVVEVSRPGERHGFVCNQRQQQRRRRVVGLQHYQRAVVRIQHRQRLRRIRRQQQQPGHDRHRRMAEH